MFEDWLDDPDYPTLYRVDRDVVVDVSRAFPGISSRRQDELPLWVKAYALRLEPVMRARHVAWIRRASDGGWLAVVLMPAGKRQWQVERHNAALARGRNDHYRSHDRSVSG